MNKKEKKIPNETNVIVKELIIKDTPEETASERLQLELKKLSEERKAFKRINLKFQQYWISLLRLIFLYVLAYLLWGSVAAKFLRKSDTKFAHLMTALLRGGMFSVDGIVTSLLKTPFNQMCYAINTDPILSLEVKDKIISRATESNEHCKETLKKFGILAITEEITRACLISSKDEAAEKNKSSNPAPISSLTERIKSKKIDSLRSAEKLIYISYLIPLFFSFYSIYSIARELYSYNLRLQKKEEDFNQEKLKFNIQFKQNKL